MGCHERLQACDNLSVKWSHLGWGGPTRTEIKVLKHRFGVKDRRLPHFYSRGGKNGLRGFGGNRKKVLHPITGGKEEHQKWGEGVGGWSGRPQ